MRALTFVLAAAAALLGIHETARAQTEVAYDWSLTPSELNAGDQFRLLFISSTTRDASSTDIADYNTHVKAAANAGHTDIQSYSTGFRVVACTLAKDAVDNTSTTGTGTGVSIYWLNGNKVADSYTDFYDGTWDDETSPKNESGTAQTWLDSASDSEIFTGCENTGTRDISQYLGTTTLSSLLPGTPDQVVIGELADSGGNPLTGGTTRNPSHQGRFYALSEVFQVVAVAPGKPTGLTVGTVTPTKIPLSWTAPTNTGGAAITSYTMERAPDVSGSAGTWAVIGTASTASYTDSSLTPETTYHYRVSATNSAGRGTASDSTSGTTAALPVVRIEAQNATVTEGSFADFAIRRDGNSFDEIDVYVALSATGDMGIATGNATVNLPAGTSAVLHSVRTRGDAVDEEDGSVTATLRTESDGVTIVGYTIGMPDTATVTVEDDDTVPGTPIVSALGHDKKLVLNWSKPAEGTSSINGYDYRYKTTAGAEATWSAWADTGLSGADASNDFEVTGLINGTDYTVEIQAKSDAGVSLAGSANATPTPPPAITSVAITSDPGTDKTYIIGDDIVVTLTFDKNITLSGTGADPSISINIGTEELNPGCEVGTAPTKDLVCTRTVYESLEDSDGVEVGGNSLDLLGKQILGPLGQSANTDHSGLADDSDHKVDGVKPTLSSANASGDLTKVVLTFSEAIGTVDGTKITVKKGGTTQTTTGAAIDSTNSTKVEITLMTAFLSTDTNITVELDADAVADVPGNGIDAVSSMAVSLVDNTAPTFVSAGTNDTDEVVLTYSEALDTGSQPATSAFTVEVGGEDRGVDTVAISGRAVTLTLTLASAFRPGDALTVSYAKPGSNPIKDAANNEAVSLAETTVTNNLAATAPEAPRGLSADFDEISTAPLRLAADILELSWVTPWHNGSPIEKYQYRYAAGSSVPPSTTWTDVPGGANEIRLDVTGLDADTEYTFEVRAKNGIGYSTESAVTRTTPDPAWSFTLRDSANTNVTQLVEGGASATATVSITNNVRFSTAQEVTLKWADGVLEGISSLIQGVGGTTLTIPALSLAHDVSGLGSTRVVRFGLSVGRDRDEPDDVATGTQDADVSECAGALAGTTPVCAGGGGDAGDERAELPPLPAPLRGRWPRRIVRPKARQGVRAPRAGRPDRMGARAVPNPPYGLDGQALPRPSLRPPWLRLELHLDQDHLAARRLGVQGTQARRPPSPAPAQALRRHDAPSGRLTP